MKPLNYIKAELGLTAGEMSREWRSLSDTDQAVLKQWAIDEMNAVGLVPA
jgi:hypothetical protein